jgi:hypothetical protein
MKKWMKVGLIAMLLTSTVYAYTGFGVCNYGNQVVSSVICYKPAVLKQTTINGDIKVTGSLQAFSITVQSMLIEGDVDIEDSRVFGNVSIIGDLFADNVEFKKGIAVTGDSIVLKGTKVNGLVIVTSETETPYLEVQCGSKVKGSVLFNDKAGVIKITDDSIIQGKVVNGSFEFVKAKCEK